MSRENVERIERFFELFNRRELDAWAAMLAPDVEWHVDPQDPDTTVHRSRDAVTRYASMWVEMMDASIQLREVLEGPGDQVMAWTRVESRGIASGALAGQDLAFIFTLRGGLVVHAEETQDKSEALEAVRLSE